ncbi:hypothetical protein RDV64_21450 [Acuticoccus sp. MNP-M23]|uniref:hypothetical protein n=1 Tax=Acuticoccus sp. MNP-M23 TaxID=3072793 RepID=UPI0028160959|nr:hypothetical protein [Acuticoccus sp. MNP-M23]WMS42597.1 hypothetical protein RDV64_21450 [Acuticoccus sp. MNP-M23]
MSERLALKERICTEILYALHDFGDGAITDLSEIANALMPLLGSGSAAHRPDIPLYAEIRAALDAAPST